MLRSSLRSQRAFTLVELLVVIAIIGILVALLLPAVQSAREAARRMQCQNNVKQLALALHNYHDVQGGFPPSATFATLSDAGTKTTNLGPNWVIMILPYIEQQSLYNAFNFTKFIEASENQIPRSTQLSAMMCPSDGYNRIPFKGSSDSTTSGMGDGWARGNYGANGTLALMRAGDGAGPDSNGWKDNLTRGVMGVNVSVNLGQIMDGTSNTILIGELRAGVVDIDSRGIWAMSGACPSSLWAHGTVGDDNGPNSLQPLADDTFACTKIRAKLGDSDGTKMQKLGVPCSTGDWPNFQQTARSSHTGGVQTAFADGSVHFIGDFIQIARPATGVLSVWEKLNASSDRLVISASEY